jgi:hypothetical protein
MAATSLQAGSAAVSVLTPSPQTSALLGTILAWALFADAVRSERATNKILLDSIADRRVQSPTLARLETRAVALVSHTLPELMSRAAKDAALALQGSATSVERVLLLEAAPDHRRGTIAGSGPW